MIRRLIASTTALALSTAPGTLAANAQCNTNAMIVFDGSASMAETGSKETRESRIEEAHSAVARAMPLIAPYRRVGLIVYGPNPGTGMPGSCTGIDLRFAPEPDAAMRVLEEVQLLAPAGLTPLTDAVAQAAETLNYTQSPGLIVLITDGNETCGGSPCQLAAELSAAARDLTVHVIGFHVRASDFTSNDKVGDGGTAAECLPALNGGSYVHADSVETLADALGETLGCDEISARAVPRTAG